MWRVYEYMCTNFKVFGFTNLQVTGFFLWSKRENAHYFGKTFSAVGDLEIWIRKTYAVIKSYTIWYLHKPVVVSDFAANLTNFKDYDGYIYVMRISHPLDLRIYIQMSILWLSFHIIWIYELLYKWPYSDNFSTEIPEYLFYFEKHFL